ncbi:MAG: formyltransferase family protein [Eubacteriales bacterium]|nr:formyltransferase family protein [Eubacteriales bacterium]
MKIAYAGFDLLYPVLESLYDNGCEIVKIFTNKVDNITEFNTSVTAFAQKHNIELSYDKITTDDLLSLQSEGVDALFCAAYYYRVPILKGFKMVNVHPTFLPYGRGAWPMPMYILNNRSTSGVTFHKMEESFDTGDILMQKSFELKEKETLSGYMEKVYSLIPSIVGQLVADLDYYYDNAQEQADGEYLEAPDERDFIITEETDFEAADKILRAFEGFYVIYYSEGCEHRLLNAHAVKGNNENKKFKISGGYIAID